MSNLPVLIHFLFLLLLLLFRHTAYVLLLMCGIRVCMVSAEEAEEESHSFMERSKIMSEYSASWWKAEELANKIVRRYGKYNVGISIKDKDIEILEDRFRFKVKLRAGTRVDDIKRYEKDIRIGLKLSLFQVMQEDLSIFIIASKNVRSDYSLYRVWTDPNYAEALQTMDIAHPIGINALGEVVIKDLALYPHALIAGTTGAGKSLAIKVLLLSILYSYSPARVNLLIGDMAGDLLPFSGFPHLSHPIIQDFDTFLYAMIKLRDEMERRIKLKGSRTYVKLPYVVCVIDEFTSFISGTDNKAKQAREVVLELLRRGRHAKICLILAAHNPTQKRLKLDVSDIPTKLVFRVAGRNNSLAVLGKGGAEKLPGEGAMLFQSSQSGELEQIQGAFFPPEKLHKILSVITFRWTGSKYASRMKFSIGKTDLQFIEQRLMEDSQTNPLTTRKSNDEKLFTAIILWALGQVSISCNTMMQTFGLGWNRASRFIERLNNMGLVENLDAKLPRRVIPQSLEDIPTEIMDFFEKNGISTENLEEAICRRKKC